MLNFDSDIDTNANADVKCEQSIKLLAEHILALWIALFFVSKVS